MSYKQWAASFIIILLYGNTMVNAGAQSPANNSSLTGADPKQEDTAQRKKQLLEKLKFEWSHLSKDELISKADAIAIININEIIPGGVVAYSFPGMRLYRQRGLASVEQLFKGQLPKHIIIDADLQVIGIDKVPTQSLKIGRSIVCLNHDGDALVPMNTDLAIQPIVNDEIDWYGPNVQYRQRTKVSTVINDIKSKLKQTNYHK